MVVRERGVRMLFKKRVPKVPVSPKLLAASNCPTPSFLAADLAIVGTIVSPGEVVADGHIRGPCCAGRLTIGENGAIEGSVIASELIINGHVEGDLNAMRVRLRALGTIDGDLCYHTLSVEDGARLNGTCRYADDPLASVATPLRERFAQLVANPATHPNVAP